jgi:hypothetical protein
MTVAQSIDVSDLGLFKLPTEEALNSLAEEKLVVLKRKFESSEQQGKPFSSEEKNLLERSLPQDVREAYSHAAEAQNNRFACGVASALIAGTCSVAAVQPLTLGALSIAGVALSPVIVPVVLGGVVAVATAAFGWNLYKGIVNRDPFEVASRTIDAKIANYRPQPTAQVGTVAAPAQG